MTVFFRIDRLLMVQTAGVTSSAVQAPGSGSALLTSTPTRIHPIHRDSEPSTAPLGDAERTETSGGYSNISESDLVDESSGQVAGEHGEDFPLEEEYEDDEDRLIAQGGVGIPVDEVGAPVRKSRSVLMWIVRTTSSLVTRDGQAASRLEVLGLGFG